MQSAVVPADTDVEAFRLQVQRWRSMTPAERLAVADQLSRDVIALAVAGIELSKPDATGTEIRQLLLRRRFGRAFADAAFGTPFPA